MEHEFPSSQEGAEMLGAKSRTFYRWAITTDSHRLIGVGRFIGAGRRLESVTTKYPYLISTMLFRTRQEARGALPHVKGPKERGLFPDARVVRVSVLIKVEGE